MTKFISTIAIAVFLEALVSVFEASKEEVRLMLYPTLLLFGGIALVVGLGVYQRLSAAAEKRWVAPRGRRKPRLRHRRREDGTGGAHSLGRTETPVLAARAGPGAARSMACSA